MLPDTDNLETVEVINETEENEWSKTRSVLRQVNERLQRLEKLVQETNNLVIKRVYPPRKFKKKKKKKGLLGKRRLKW